MLESIVWTMVIIPLVLAAILPFLMVGSIPFGVIASKIFKLGDLKKIGSGNIGATNVLRSGNKKAAIFTLVGDFLKGYLPIAGMVYLGHELSLYYYIGGILIVLGHIFSIFLNFKGGKGVATGLGVMVAWNPLLGILTIATWLIVAKLFKISSLSALIAFVLTPVYAFIYAVWYGNGGGSLFVCIAFTLPYIILAGIILCTHQDNIRRLVKGEEIPTSSKKA